MKKLLCIAMLLFVGITNAQKYYKPLSTKVESPNVSIDGNGNYREKVDVFTGHYYINKEGQSFPVYLTKNGKLYAITGTSEKTGKPKRKYIKL